MSITLNNSDFQCLQDQLVDLKTKNYELAEKNRRSQADFEAAKAKICSLQLKLEEQERDFQVTSTTLRREIELSNKSNSSGSPNVENDSGKDEDYKTKYKKLLHKAKELQQRYEKSVVVIQQMDDKIKLLMSKSTKLEEENKKLRDEYEDKQQKIVTIEQEFSKDLNSAIEEYMSTERSECLKHVEDLNAIKIERDSLQAEVETLRDEVKAYNAKIESLAEERRIQDKKGLQLIKELKRQLTTEKNRNETLQKRLENVLSESASNAPNLSSSGDFDKTRLSTSSNGNSRDSRGANGSGNNNIHCDDNSVSSWSLVAKGKTSTPSICSIESEDRETVQLPGTTSSINCDTISQGSQQHSPFSKSISRSDLVSQQSSNSPRKQKHSSSTSLSQNSMSIGADFNRTSDSAFGLKYEDQAALMERVTRLQHDKWTLEEKLSYMEQANAALTQDLADKSQIVRQYFMDQAIKSAANNNHSMISHNSNSQGNAASAISSGVSSQSSSRRVSFPNNFNHLISDKPSLKKVMDFLKERGQVSSIIGAGESETISREATKKMQLMLEETLIKCLKLQENLDSVVSELNKTRS